MALSNIINELVVTSVTDSIKFYEDNFGFTLDFTDGDPVIWAQVKKDNIILMFQDYNDAKNNINNFPVKVNNSNLIMFEYSNANEVKELYETLKKNNVKLFEDYTETDYGKVELGIYDIDRNMIIISAPME